MNRQPKNRVTGSYATQHPFRREPAQVPCPSSTGPSAATPSRTLVQSGAGPRTTLPDYVGRYLQVGSPSPAAVTSGFVVLTPMPQLKFVSWLCVFVASHAPA